MKEAKVGAKCTIRMDLENWLEIWDGHDTIALAPDEVEALRKFLAETPTSEPSPGDGGPA